MEFKISDLPGTKIQPAQGDTSTTIAHLAQFVSFKTSSEPNWCAAYEALFDEYSGFEMTNGCKDFYDGAFMTFSDGSTITMGPV